MQKKIRGHGMELSVGSSDRSWCLVGSMDSGEKDGSSVQNHMSGVQKSCAICNTTKTPLWRGGPAGPKSLCNACGIKYRKKSGDPPGCVIKQERKLRANRRNRSGVPFKLELAASSRSDVLCQGLLLHKQRKLAEEEEAAVLLMALSWGLIN